MLEDDWKLCKNTVKIFLETTTWTRLSYKVRCSKHWTVVKLLTYLFCLFKT